MNWGLLVYALTVEGLGFVIYPFLEQSAIQANSLFGWYVSLAILFSSMMGGVALSAAGLIMSRPVSSGQAKGVLGISLILALAFSVGVLWSEVIYSDLLVDCPYESGSGRLTSCDLLQGQSFLPILYGIDLVSCVLILASSARIALSLNVESVQSSVSSE